MSTQRYSCTSSYFLPLSYRAQALGAPYEKIKEIITASFC